MKTKEIELEFKDSAGWADIAAVGSLACFYAYDHKRSPDCYSDWLTSSKGAAEYWPKLLKAYKTKNRVEFQKIVNEIFEKFPKK